MTDDATHRETTADSVPDTVEAPTHCETCGTTMETGLVGVAESDLGDSPHLPATTVVEVFCPNPDCPDRKPEHHPAAATEPGSLGGDNGGA